MLGYTLRPALGGWGTLSYTPELPSLLSLKQGTWAPHRTTLAQGGACTVGLAPKSDCGRWKQGPGLHALGVQT